MQKQHLYFLLGTIFAYNLQLTKSYPIFHIISFVIFTFISIEYINSFYNLTTNIDLDHTLIVTMVIFFIENRIIARFIRFNFLMRIGVLIMIIGYGISISSHLFYLKQKRPFVYQGIYKYMRQPVILGIIIIYIGGLFYTCNILTGIYIYLNWGERLINYMKNREMEIVREDGNYRKYINSIRLFGFY